jgi:large subunit ribosomal protein L21
MTYAIVSIGGKQYRVREGERLLVDRLPQEEGKTFHPNVLLSVDDGKTQVGGKGVTVTARVVGHVLGDKVRIGKYRPKSGYRRHTGFRAHLSQIQIERIGAAQRRAAAAGKEQPEEASEPLPKGLPKGYGELTVAEIAEAAPGWRRPMVEAAVQYEQAHAKRKGALHALESALEEKEETD